MSNMIKSEMVVKALHNGEFAEHQLKMLIDGVLTEVDLGSYEEPIINLEIGAYTTLFDDPSNSIMLHYMTVDDKPVECLYRKTGTSEWLPVELFADKPFPLTGKRVRWFKLEGLTPNTIYETRLKYHDKVHRFKTLPDTLSDIKIASISDQMNSINNFQTEGAQGFELMKNQNVDIIALVGDGVHDDGHRADKWTLFFDKYFEFAADHFMIPIVTCLGNHDGRVDDSQSDTQLWYVNGATKDDVVFHYNFFSNLNDVGYGVIDVSDYMSLVFLNSYHTQPVIGDQTTWLGTALSSRQDRQHIFPIFHAPPYPSWYSYDGSHTRQMRDNWTPLFTQYGIKIAANGHEHTNLVTKKVTGESVDENGVVYTTHSGPGNVTRGTKVTEETWFVDYIDIDTRAIDIIEFKTNGEVVLNKTALNGSVLYSTTL